MVFLWGWIKQKEKTEMPDIAVSVIKSSFGRSLSEPWNMEK